ncbi:hypothetical protein PF011_g21639 [Phytophthora fragariae]|uniref:Uncharacterized protein n=1 Tax=Phytophthora fragariae TaxID=53985 RepID=A0A6A3IGX4_9STRA|nr:hypothetical protein PF011_g21639 [Phytophthora fragariae]
MGSRCHLLVDLWRSTQVKQHGSYSAGRVQDLAKYERLASFTRAIGVIVVTPLPCLAVTLFIDMLPLSPPSDGIHSNKLFLVREFYAFLVMTLLTLNQFRKGIPVLPYPTRKLIRDTFLVSGIIVGIMYGLILAVGFPLPFTTLTMVPPWTVLVLVCMGAQWAQLIRETAGAAMMFIGMMKLWVCDNLLVFVYPPYFYVFTTLSTTGQIAFVLLLPVIKVLMRKLFSRAVQHLSDETPGIIVFNADVFGSLFVAYCMQRSPSTWTTTGVMMLDIITMTLALRDVHNARKELQELEQQLDKAHAWRSYMYHGARKNTDLALELSHQRPPRTALSIREGKYSGLSEFIPPTME